MKRLFPAVSLIALCLSHASAAPIQKPTLPESVKTARTKALGFGQVERVNAIAKALLDAKKQQAANDQRSGLASELEGLRSKLISQRLAQAKQPVKLLDTTDNTHAVASGPNAQVGVLSDAVTALKHKRTSLEPLDTDNPGLTDAIKEVTNLETELTEIAALPPEERSSRLNELSLRLTPHRASEFASAGRPQPTLTIGRPTQTDE